MQIQFWRFYFWIEQQKKAVRNHFADTSNYQQPTY